MNGLSLRPVEAGDLPVVGALLAHPALVGRRGLDQDRPAPRSVTALTTAIEALVDPDHGDAWVVHAGGPVGLAMVDWWWDALTPWAHVVIAPDHHRQGNGSRAAALIFDHLFGTTPAALVQYSVPSWDDAGLAFAGSIAGETVGRRRRAGIRDGAYYDQIEFAMPRKTWEARRAPRG